MKTYNTKQAAELLGLTYHALRKQLDRDAKLDKHSRKYPNARKCECGHSWILSDKDVRNKK